VHPGFRLQQQAKPLADDRVVVGAHAVERELER
jgi:hypothetical protein